jgi:hypothetical protein
MSYFAHIDENNVVDQVIVADADFVNSGVVGDPTHWIETDPNVRNGVHYDSQGQPDNEPALRKNYAVIGYTYDQSIDAFVPPKPFDSWHVNAATGSWDSPVAKPPAQDDVRYVWDEADQKWNQLPLPHDPQQPNQI